MTTQLARQEPKQRTRPAAQSSGTATTLALIGAIVTTIANFGVAVLVTRIGAAFAGLFFAATAVVTILGNSSALGTMTGLVYFMPTALTGPHPNPRSLLEVALRPVLAAGIGVGALLIVAAGPLASLIAADGADQIKSMLRVLAFAVPCWAVTVSLLGATRGLGSMTPTVVVNQILRPLGQLGLLGAVVATEPDPAGSTIAVAWGLPILIGVGATVFSVWRLGGLAGGSPGDRRAPVSSSEFWRYARPRATSTAFQIALERIDVVLVSALAGEAAAGIYGALSRFITAGNFLIFAIGQATSSELRRALAAGRRVDAQALLSKTTGWMVLLAWPYFLVLAVKAGVLANLLSPEFDVGASALTVLAVAMLANAFAGPVDLALLMLGRTKASLAITVVALTIDLAIAAYAIPRFGLVGAAIGWGAAVIIQNGLASLQIFRIGQLRAGGRPAIIAAAGAVVAVVPMGLLTPDHLGGVTVTVAIGGLIWLAVAAGFRRQLGLVRQGAANQVIRSSMAAAEVDDES